MAEEETKRAPRRPLARKEKVSGVELAKRASRHLRGGIRESLVDAEPGLSEEVVYNRSLRITTRQNFQLHGVLKGDLGRTIRQVNDVLLSTLCGCGDVERNIVAPPAPIARGGHRVLHSLAVELTEAMTPATNAYHEIWLDGECVGSSRESEPLYGVFAESVPRERPVARAEPLLEDWAERRLPKEGLGDFYDRCLRGAGRRDILSGAKGAGSAGSAGSEPSPARAESAR